MRISDWSSDVCSSDLASTAAQPIAIAPCCCARATASEAALLDVLARAEISPEKARLLLADQLGTRAVDGVLASAAAVAAAFADAGRPNGRSTPSARGSPSPSIHRLPNQRTPRPH